MKKFLFGGSMLLLLTLTLSFTFSSKKPAGKTLKWYSWEEAIKLNEENPKKLFVDVYTNWCGWCKKMDKTTFMDPQVVSYLNENFYPVKFNAEQKENVEYKGHTLKFLANAGRRGVHELAVALLDQRMSYPSYVYMDEDQKRISISPGYKTPDALIKELRFINDGHYKTTTWQEFQRNK